MILQKLCHPDGVFDRNQFSRDLYGRTLKVVTAKIGNFKGHCSYRAKALQRCATVKLKRLKVNKYGRLTFV